MKPERDKFSLPETSTPKNGFVKEAVYDFLATVAFVGALVGVIPSERFEHIMHKLDTEPPTPAPTAER